MSQKIFRVVKFVNNGSLEDFMVSLSWSTTDFEILLLNSSHEANQFKTTIKERDLKELLKAQDELQTSGVQISVLKEQLDTLENALLNLTDEKERQEEALFRKFALLLNAKKKKIKELRKELYPDEKGEFDESDEEPLRKRCSSGSESSSSTELQKKPKRKSLQLLEPGSDTDNSDNDFSAQTQVMDVLPKRVKLDDVVGNQNSSPQPGTSAEEQTQTSQELLEML